MHGITSFESSLCLLRHSIRSSTPPNSLNESLLSSEMIFCFSVNKLCVCYFTFVVERECMKDIQHFLHNFLIFSTFFECFNNVPANTWLNFFFIHELFFNQLQLNNGNSASVLTNTFIYYLEASPRL